MMNKFKEYLFNTENIVKIYKIVIIIGIIIHAVDIVIIILNYYTYETFVLTKIISGIYTIVLFGFYLSIGVILCALYLKICIFEVQSLYSNNEDECFNSANILKETIDNTSKIIILGIFIYHLTLILDLIISYIFKKE